MTIKKALRQESIKNKKNKMRKIHVSLDSLNNIYSVQFLETPFMHI